VEVISPTRRSASLPMPAHQYTLLVQRRTVTALLWSSSVMWAHHVLQLWKA
jgi:hypothetical protein